MDDTIKQLPKLDSITAQMVLREAYETIYEIFNHDYSQHPWDLVLHRQKEEVNQYDPMNKMIRRYRLKDVHGRYGLNLVEFLEFPRYMVKDIFKACDEIARVESRIYNDVEKKVNK